MCTSMHGCLCVCVCVCVRACVCVCVCVHVYHNCVSYMFDDRCLLTCSHQMDEMLSIDKQQPPKAGTNQNT